MSLIERYIQEVGRHLPRKNREDIKAELRSSVVDTMEDRFGPEPTEAETAELLKELGKPRDVAASYHPQGQYLIGPTLYPLFRMIIGIVIAAVLGAQLLAWGISAFVAGEAFSVLEMFFSLLNSIPVSLGWVVITFMILQRFDAQPHLEEDPWDPQTLPDLNPDQDIKRGELIVGLVFSILIMVLVFFFPQWIGFITTPGGKFYPNPVILENLSWVKISLITGVIFNIYLLWKGRWGTITRIVNIAVDIFSIFVLGLLIRGHNLWLAARNSGGFLEAVEAIPDIVNGNWEIVGMQAFRMAFVVAMIVTTIEIIVAVYRLFSSNFRSDFSPEQLVTKIEK